eukprot:TRINITY_DN811_c0_g1_i7.p1 TRINITY_DN811_c0_g1~~TRINITY_DN811_c0_g1_i7.p1  ORF type:complete len:119 (-),score=19.11 TRINITY_DN811_c0_g1_i7:230-586(-)
MSETGQLKEKLAFGSLEVRVLEVRELPVHLFVVRYELAEKTTEIKKHASATHTFQDVLNFKIMRMHGDVEVEAWHKHKLFKAFILFISLHTFFISSLLFVYLVLSSLEKSCFLFIYLL